MHRADGIDWPENKSFPMISTANNSAKKPRFSPMNKTSQRNLRRTLRISKEKEDSHWFSSASIKDLRELAGPMNTANKLPSIGKPSETPVQAINEPDPVIDDSQSFMNFVNTKMNDGPSFCGLFTDQAPEEVLAVENNNLVWVCVPVAVDTGSCAHVTPPNVFAIDVQGGEASKSKPFFGADNKPIANLGNQKVVANCNEGHAWTSTFAVAERLARPLASGYEITESGNEVAIWKGGGHIKCQKSGAKTALRQEGKLWFLDLWTQVPKSIANSGFARPS